MGNMATAIGGVEYLEAGSPLGLRDEIRRWLGENRVLEASQIYFLPPMPAPAPPPAPETEEEEPTPGHPPLKFDSRHLVFGAYILYIRSASKHVI